MRKLYTVFCLLAIFGFGNSVINAQITLTYSDLQASTSEGVLLTNNVDTIATSWNIGSTGASSWDFRGLTSHTKYAITYLNPASTPFIAFYPGANAGEKMTIDNNGVPVDFYIYALVNSDGFNFLGLSYSVTLAPGLTSEMRGTKSNPDLSIKVPLSMGTSWNVNYMDTTLGFFNGNRVSDQFDNYSKNYTVDAYGSATWPDGNVYQVLRLKSDARRTSTSTHTGNMIYTREISYSFIAREGISVEIIPLDSTQATSGTIQLGGNVNWTTGGATGISDINSSPNDFLLYQNYPNPFNPSTIITYQLAKPGKVNLRVYDMLGKEVASLVNEVKPAGTYSVTFNASNLPSGVYVYRINTSNFTKTNKMILIK